MKTIKISLFILLFSCSIGCGPIDVDGVASGDRFLASNNTNSNLMEVATPKTIGQLNQTLEQYIPQVEIIAPRTEQTFNQTDIEIKLKVQNLPIFQDDKLKLGNHLNLIVDNEPIQEIYNPEQVILVKDLSPGTHTIRVFAARPWGESYKNENAYAQATFNVLTETNDNRPKADVPLLTYNSPTGIYGSEPFLLDFYLTNAPLHAVAQNNSQLQDWKIKATINGDSFLLEDWQPVYLTGLNQGQNWIQLELIDELGNNIENAFNNTVRVINYDPQQVDTLSKLVTDKISLAEAQAVVEQNYYTQPVGIPEIIEPKADNVEVESKIESTTTEKKPFSAIEPVEEPMIKVKTESKAVVNNTQPETTLSEPKNSTILLKIDEPNEPSVSQEKTISNNLIERAEETNSNPNLVEKPVALDRPLETIAIARADSDEPVATIKIPQPESLEIAEEKIIITIPETEPAVLPEPEPKSNKPLWLKKILVGLRQKLESLAKLLPSET